MDWVEGQTVATEQEENLDEAGSSADGDGGRREASYSLVSQKLSAASEGISTSSLALIPRRNLREWFIHSVDDKLDFSKLE
mgnify:CR=1 FL=1